MDDRTRVGIALAVAAGMVGSAFLLLRRPKAISPRIVAQRLIPGSLALPPRVRIDLDPPSALKSLAASVEGWEYRVVDAEGRVYVSLRNCDDATRTLFVPIAYGRPVRSPRVEVWKDGRWLGAAPLAPLPAPVVASLDARPSPRIRACHVRREGASSAYEEENRGEIRFEPSHPLASGESWTIEVVRTTLQEHPQALARLGAGPPDRPAEASGRTSLRYAEDVAGMEVRVVRTVQRRRSERIVLGGLRMVPKGGGIALECGASRVPNSLGLDIRLTGGALWDLSKSPGNAQGTPGRPGRPAAPVQYARLGIATLNAGGGVERVRFLLDDATRKALALRSLDLSEYGEWIAKGKPSKAALGKPFSVWVKVEKPWTETVETFEATIPVEP